MSREEIAALAQKSKEMKMAMEHLKSLSRDQAVRFQEEAQEKFYRDFVASKVTVAQRSMKEGREKGLREGLQKGLQKGRQEGMEKGRRQVALSMLQKTGYFPYFFRDGIFGRGDKEAEKRLLEAPIRTAGAVFSLAQSHRLRLLRRSRPKIGATCHSAQKSQNTIGFSFQGNKRLLKIGARLFKEAQDLNAIWIVKNIESAPPPKKSLDRKTGFRLF